MTGVLWSLIPFVVGWLLAKIDSDPRFQAWAYRCGKRLRRLLIEKGKE